MLKEILIKLRVRYIFLSFALLAFCFVSAGLVHAESKHYRDSFFNKMTQKLSDDLEAPVSVQTPSKQRAVVKKPLLEPQTDSRTSQSTKKVREVVKNPSGSKRFYLQIGAYSDEGIAEDVSMRVGNASITTILVDGIPLYRVRLGPFASREKAQRTILELRESGFDRPHLVVE